METGTVVKRFAMDLLALCFSVRHGFWRSQACLLAIFCFLAMPWPGFAQTRSGTLVALGGGSENVELIQEVLELARGRDSRVLILNTASSNPAQSGAAYERFFQQRLGVKRAAVLPLLSRDQAYDPAMLSLIGEADLIYATGGNQIRLAQVIQGTPAHGALLSAWQRGVVLAGTSAGAMVWGPTYITSGLSASALRRGISPGSLELRDGLGLLPDVLVDTHFGREGRLGRLLVASAHSPGVWGLGVDEGTAAVVTSEGVRVFGEGRVSLLDFSRAQVKRPLRPPISMRDVEMHILGAGESLRWRRDENERVPMLAPPTRLPLEAAALWLQGKESVPASLVAADDSKTAAFAPLPEELLVLAGNDAISLAQRWQSALTSAGRTTVRILSADQVRSPLLTKYLTIAGGLILVEDPAGTLASALRGNPGTVLREHLKRLQCLAAAATVGIVGEPATRTTAAGRADLAPGLRFAPGMVATPDVWRVGALERLAVDALLANGAIGIGLTPSNGIRLVGHRINAWGDDPVLVLETGKVSLANPALSSARDLRLHLMAPGDSLSY
jgi:cyanophycinase